MLPYHAQEVGWDIMKHDLTLRRSKTLQDAEIQKHGVLCAIYNEDLWDDHAAVDSLMLDGNLNCGVNMGEDAFALFGKAHALMTLIQEAHSQQNTEAPEFNFPHMPGWLPHSSGNSM